MPRDAGPTMSPTPARQHPACNALPTYVSPVGEVSSPFDQFRTLSAGTAYSLQGAYTMMAVAAP